MAAVTASPVALAQHDASLFTLAGDLPSAGRSVFDPILEPYGGELPFPFGRLFDAIQGSTDRLLHVVTAPNGRSLSRFSTTTSDPRILLAVSDLANPAFTGPAAPGLLSQGELFVGFARKSRSLEAFAYNRELDRYEVLISPKYEKGARPRLYYASRALCMSCHQEETPIFPSQNWNEIGEIDAKTAKELGLTRPQDRSDLDHFSRSHLTSASGYQDSVMAGFLKLESRKLAKHLCGGDPDCLGTLVRAVLEARVYGAHSIPPKTKTALKRVLKALNTKPFLLSSPIIANLYPWQVNSRKPLPEELDPMTPRKLRMTMTFDEGGYKLGHNASLFLMFGTLDRGGELPLESILGILTGLVPGREAQRIFRESGLTKKAFSQSLKTFRLTGTPARSLNLQSIQGAVAKHFGVTGPSKAKAAPVLPAEVSAYAERMRLSDPAQHRGVLGLFKKYCGECHAGAPDDHLNFLQGKNDREILAKLLAQPNLLKRLDPKTPDQQRMPPPSREQGRALRENAADLQAMRELVDPSICPKIYRGVR